MFRSLTKVLGGRERVYTIIQTFPACELDGIELSNEPVIDAKTHMRIQLTRQEAEGLKDNYPNGRAVPYKRE